MKCLFLHSYDSGGGTGISSITSFSFVVFNYIHFLFLQIYMGVMESLHVVPPLSTGHSGECGSTHRGT